MPRSFASAAARRRHGGPDPEGPPETDEGLMARVGAGDQDALSEIYDRYSPMVYGRAAGLLDRAEDAEEVTLDVFLQLWRTPDRWDSGRGSLAAWLAVMVRSRAADRRRSRARRVERLREAAIREGGGFCVEPGQPVDTPSRGGCRAILSPLLAALKSDQREAILLVFCQGLSQREAAEALGEPLGTVKSRIRRGLRSLGDAARSSPNPPPLFAGD